MFEGHPLGAPKPLPLSHSSPGPMCGHWLFPVGLSIGYGEGGAVCLVYLCTSAANALA